jgi:hypothetical protein
MASRGRTNSQSPAAGMPPLLSRHAEGSSSLRASPQTPINVVEDERDLNDLISEFSKPADNTPNTPEMINIDQHPAKVPVPSIGSPTVPPSKANGTGNGKLPGYITNKNIGNRYVSHGTMLEVSEGELDDAAQKIMRPEPKQEKQLEATKIDEGHVLRRTKEDKPSPYAKDVRETQPSRRENRVDKYVDRYEEDLRPVSRRERSEPRSEPRPERITTSRSDYNEHRPEKQLHRREIHELNEEIRRPEPSITKTKIPTLSQVLPHDEDLREWLEITGFHNGPYRDKILERRRKLAKLDAEKAQLLAEMAQEERGPVAATNTAPVTVMPPPVPSRAEPPRTDTFKTVATEIAESHPRIVSNKRSYSGAQDERNEYEESSSKVMRTDERNDRGPRAKMEKDENRPRRQVGYDSFKPGSSDKSDERPYEEGRGRNHRSSREREVSPGPGLRAYEHRPVVRSRDFDADEPQDNWKPPKDTRPFEVHGGYRGRAYDPNYRGRGRGASRGRGEGRGDLSNRDDFQDRDYRDFSGRRGDYQGRGDYSSRGDLRNDFRSDSRGDFHAHADRPEGTFGTVSKLEHGILVRAILTKCGSELLAPSLTRTLSAFPEAEKVVSETAPPRARP